MVGIFGLKNETINYALQGAVRLVAGTAILWECQWIAFSHLKWDLTRSINRASFYAVVLTGSASLYLISMSVAYFFNASRTQQGRGDLLPLHKWKLLIS